MTRAAATAYAISLAREHLGDYVPDADVTLTTSREPTTAIGGGVRLVVTLTVVVDDPDAAAESLPPVPCGDTQAVRDKLAEAKRLGLEACEFIHSAIRNAPDPRSTDLGDMSASAMGHDNADRIRAALEEL